jgi:hypothetical protein
MTAFGQTSPFRAPAGRSGIGASRPLRRIPAIVSFLNPQPALRLVGGTALHAPFRTFRQPDVEAQLGRKLALGVHKSAGGFAVRKNVEIKSVQVFDLDV